MHTALGKSVGRVPPKPKPTAVAQRAPAGIKQDSPGKPQTPPTPTPDPGTEAVKRTRDQWALNALPTLMRK